MDLSKRTVLEDEEEKFHKSRVAFMIVNDKILYLKNSEMSHFMWAKELGIEETEFPKLVRGSYKDGKAIFYKANFDFDDECVQKAKHFAEDIKEYCSITEIECWCGQKQGKIGVPWPPIYFVGKF